ncbi:pyridoxine 4-dehydrogenase [Dichotomocladium elegans]|nr:pyridoxine 4-dehydrogenase [Dichotomocladium elegans]
MIQRSVGDKTFNGIGLGCMGLEVAKDPPMGSMSDWYGADRDDDKSLQVLERAIDIGCTFWDTANAYGMGDNERLLGRVLKTSARDKVFVSTKFGVVRDPATGAFLTVNGRPEYVRSCFEESTKNLGVDVVDMYYYHRVDPDVPIEETVAAMAELVKEGRVRFLGLSECTADQLRRAHKVHPITAIEMEYSPWVLDIETNGVLDAARELRVKIVCYSPLGRGFLTGKIRSADDLAPDDIRRKFPRYYPENFQKNLDIVDKISALAARKGVTTSQFVLAWVLAQGDDFIVIPGTTKIDRLEENARASEIVLTPKEIDEMRQVITIAQVAGGRHAVISDTIMQKLQK